MLLTHVWTMRLIYWCRFQPYCEQFSPQSRYVNQVAHISLFCLGKSKEKGNKLLGSGWCLTFQWLHTVSGSEQQSRLTLQMGRKSRSATAANIFLSLVHKCAPVHQKRISPGTDTFSPSAVNPPGVSFLYCENIPPTHWCVCPERQKRGVCGGR